MLTELTVHNNDTPKQCFRSEIVDHENAPK